MKRHSFQTFMWSLVALLATSGLLTSPAWAAKGYGKLDEMALDRWAKLREAERYQLNIAEKLYREQNWKAALGEYEKFVELYQNSEGASFAQLKWAMCQVQLKKLNTAVKDGYQTVIDYWPESAEAVAAAYLIGRTYKDMGDMAPAKKGYQAVLTKHADEVVAVLSKVDLAEIARIEQDRPRRVTILKDLVFNSPRTGDAARHCVEASRTLAALNFEDGGFTDGKASLETTFKEPDLAGQIATYIRAPLQQLMNASDTKDRAAKVADAAIAYFKTQFPASAKTDADKARTKTLTYYTADMHSLVSRATDAQQLYEKLLREMGNEDDILSQYASWYKSQGKRDDARATYGRMKSPIDAKSNIAYSYWEEGKYALTVPIYEELIQLDTSNPKKWQWSLAEAYRHAGKHKEAIAAYQQCENYPTNLQHMALSYRALQQYKEALAVYFQILGSYESAAPNALLNIGYTQEASGQSEAAIKTFQQVCKRFPRSGESSQAHAHLNNKYNILFTFGGDKAEK